MFKVNCWEVTDEEIELVRHAIRHRTQIKCKTVARMIGVPHHNRITNSKIGKILKILDFVPWTKKRGNQTWIRRWQYELIERLG